MIGVNRRERSSRLIDKTVALSVAAISRGLRESGGCWPARAPSPMAAVGVAQPSDQDRMIEAFNQPEGKTLVPQQQCQGLCVNGGLRQRTRWNIEGGRLASGAVRWWPARSAGGSLQRDAPATVRSWRCEYFHPSARRAHGDEQHPVVAGKTAQGFMN